MFRYIVKRLLKAVPMLLGISMLCFFLMHLAPYDAIDAITTPNMRPETIAQLKDAYGLNDPVYVQYIKWLQNVLQGNFGYSILSRSSIAVDLGARLPNTVALVLPSYAIAYVLALVLGVYAGGNKGSLADRLIDGFATLGLSVPSFWFAMVLIYVFGYLIGWFPVFGMRTVGLSSTADLLAHYVLPCLTLVVAFMPDLIRYTRSSTIGEQEKDYVLVQRAYGASHKTVLYRHIIKNVLLPAITQLGMALPMLVTGAMITESIFGWPGVGPYYVKAVQGMDYPVVMIILFLSASLVILGNLLSDILYFILDPRIRRTK
ncbi:ABC transporter permease [Peptoniphilus equinus]|uniref:ABC transporter permease n=1 Tax=Peptoniphilus equinus TaxID=3016343 RepID=A0ABY7QV25_9FIRM|nr:ABC transporter permease [Peptoniphilus equinus]WBW49934.1 ABC transporter permease [Peptoniphilus equinus]